MKRFLHRQLFYVCVLSFGVITLSGCFICMIIGWVVPRDKGLPIGRRIIRDTFRLYLRLCDALGVIHTDLSALDALDHEPGLILAPNHPSVIDVVLVNSRLSNVCCLMKAGLMDSPFLGAGARLAGYVPNDSFKAAVRASAADIRAGGQLLIFPEGTRTETRPINTLKGGFALISREAACPIQTLIIEGNTGYLGKGWSIFKAPELPMHFSVRLGKRFPATQDVATTVAELDAYFRAELAEK